MTNQKGIFKKGEGDNWYTRNTKALDSQNQEDVIVKALREIEITPKSVLEIGCANGKRLDEIHRAFDSECHGIEPSQIAVDKGNEEFSGIKLKQGTAESLDYTDEKFDVIIFGFCLYLCDRADLFKIANEADRCLNKNGHIVILDFLPNFPFKNEYSHLEGLYSYKMDYSKLFTWNPFYSEIYKNIFSHQGYGMRDVPNEKVGLTILSRNEEFAYLNSPYK